MKPAILVFCCCFFAFGQSTSPTSETTTQTSTNSSDQKPKNNDNGLGTGAHGRQVGPLDILSDTQGVDFGPYLQRVLQDVKENWYRLIPESASLKKGKLAIEFKITKDGRLAEMRLVLSSGEPVALDRPAWGSITASNPFPPLPSEFNGPFLALRLRFYYNPDKSDPAWEELGTSQRNAEEKRVASSLSGVTVSIFAPANLQVPVGGSEVVSATVTGTKESAVEWSIKGSGCSDSACGKMVGELYVAPAVLPNPPEVILIAASKADPTAEASVTVHIVRPAAQTNSTVRVEVPPVLATPGPNLPHPPGGVGGGIFHVGGGVSPPRAIYSPQPEYSEEASKAKLEGTCVLGLIVGVDGKVHNIKVLTPLGKGLDEKAINAVNTWEFEPAMKDGHPVRVEIAVEVSFHLDQKSEHPK